MESYLIPEYKCKFCGYAFTTYHSLLTHEKKAKCKDKKFSCDKCNARFAKKYTLSKHTCGRIFECDRCERKFKREHDLKMHKEKQTIPCQKEYECQGCGHKCRNSTQMKGHVLYQCEETREVPLDECRICNVTFDTEEECKSHEEYHRLGLILGRLGLGII